MTSDVISAIKNDKLMSFIAASIVRKVLTSFNGRMDYILAWHLILLIYRQFPFIGYQYRFI